MIFDRKRRELETELRAIHASDFVLRRALSDTALFSGEPISSAEAGEILERARAAYRREILRDLTRESAKLPGGYR